MGASTTHPNSTLHRDPSSFSSSSASLLLVRHQDFWESFVNCNSKRLTHSPSRLHHIRCIIRLSIISPKQSLPQSSPLPSSTNRKLGPSLGRDLRASKNQQQHSLNCFQLRTRKRIEKLQNTNLATIHRCIASTSSSRRSSGCSRNPSPKLCC